MMAPLRIALLNNMPDAAMQQTETQFRDLLAVPPAPRVRLDLFTLPGLPRGDLARRRIAASYAPFEALFDIAWDGLIVTGMEPPAGALSAEPFWPALTRVMDWAAEQALPTVFSCLAAHAAVLHRDGVPRRRLPAKLSGLYACEAAGSAHPYAAGLPQHWVTPHSRFNGLDEAELRAVGYQILSRGAAVGVDGFAAADAPFLFLQGHPEYDPLALLREYARDVARAVAGERDGLPAIPADLLDAATVAELQLLLRQATALPPKRLLVALGGIVLAARPRTHQAPGGASLFGNWIASLSDGARREEWPTFERMAS